MKYQKVKKNVMYISICPDHHQNHPGQDEVLQSQMELDDILTPWPLGDFNLVLGR